jgi:homocitrate synthase NifV
MKNTIMSPIFLDTTLRDGEQRPGISFTRNDKLDLARALDAWGVGILEAGIPAMGRAERGTLDALHGLGLNAEILVWNRLTDSDLDLCLAAGYPSAHFSVPVSDVMLSGKLGRDRAWVLNQVDRVVGRAVAAGLKVSVGAEDSSRADFAFLHAVFARACAAGASRVRYADTLGLLTPARTAREIGALAATVGAPIDFHGHDDFGLATANTLAAFEAGARVLSCSLLGLGERAGNAALEEVAGILEFLQSGAGTPVGAPFPELVAVCRLAADRAGVPVSPHKALVVFSHQSGIHVDGLLKDSRTYEAWPPEAFGGRRRLRFGKHSGPAALRHLASQRGAEVDDTEARAFLENLRDRMGALPGIDPQLDFDEFVVRRGGRP